MLPFQRSRWNALQLFDLALLIFTTEEKNFLTPLQGQTHTPRYYSEFGGEMGEFLRKETDMPTFSEVIWSAKRMTFADVSLSSCSAPQNPVNLSDKTPLWFNLLFCTYLHTELLAIHGDPTSMFPLWVTMIMRLRFDPHLFRSGQFSIFSDFVVMCSDVIHRRKAGLRMRLKRTNVGNVVRGKHKVVIHSSWFHSVKLG